MNGNDQPNKNRKPLPYRSGRHGNIPLTPESVLAAFVFRAMRLRLELYMPRDKTRWN